MLSLDAARHADRRYIDQHRWAQIAQLRQPTVVAAVGQLATRLLIARNDRALGKSCIAQGAGHGLGHTTTATQRKRGTRIHAMLL
ncbi:hypothetical protein D3C77_627340 [compost metagenome]